MKALLTLSLNKQKNQVAWSRKQKYKGEEIYELYKEHLSAVQKLLYISQKKETSENQNIHKQEY